MSFLKCFWTGICLLAVATAAAAQTDEREFALGMLAKWQEAMPEAELSLDAVDPLAVHAENWHDMDQFQINLHRVFGFCQINPAADCARVTDELIENITVKIPESSAKDLRLIVRDQPYFDYAAQTFSENPERLSYKKIGQDLYAILAFDSARAIAIADLERVEELGLTKEEAWQLAADQTAAILPTLPNGADLAESATAYEDFEYLPSIMIDLEAWAQIAKDAGPDMFITAVARDFVYVGTLPDGTGMEGLKKAVREDCNAQARCISPNIYRFREGQWVVAQ